MSSVKHNYRPDQRRRELVARLRRRQLELAMQGRIADSARVAGRVRKVRRATGLVAA